MQTSPRTDPPARRPRRRVLRWLLLAVILIGSTLLSLAVLFGGSDDEAAAVTTRTLAKGDPARRVAVVAITGEIGGGSSAQFDRVVTRVERDAEVKALVVEIDTPGGEVTASDEMYDRLLRYKARRSAAGRSPLVVISMRSMATSGGYYVACAGDRLLAEPTTLTGNVGVLMPRFNFSGLMDKYGVRETTVVATGADFKHVGSPFQPDTPQVESYLRSRIDQAFDRFKQVVRTGRSGRLTSAEDDVFNGKVFTAAEAMKLGLVDAVGYPQDAYALAASLSGAANGTVVRYQEPGPGLLGMIVGGASAAGRDQHSTAKGVENLSDMVRPETLDAWRTTRVMYR